MVSFVGMAADLQITKSAVRAEVNTRVKALSHSRRAAASADACDLLLRQPIWQQAKSILFYAPLPAELDVWPLLTLALVERKTAALPRFLKESGTYVACAVEDIDKDVSPGHLGVREPSDTCRQVALALDLILVPGVAFDLQGHRLGRGKGFYDKLLVDARGMTCGVAFDEQIVSEVPVEPHDVRLSCILTPTRWVQR